MRRLRTVAFGAAIVAALVMPASASAYGDVKGPKCADLVAGDASKANYSVGGSLGYSVDVQLQLSAPSCANVTYTFEVYTVGGGTLLGSATLSGGDGATDAQTGLPVIVLHVDFAAGGALVDTVATTSRSGKLLDRGPDIGFETLALGSSAAGRGYG